ncbi:MAG: GntR family transcriptional regulator [Blautia marasmi]
MRRDKFYLSDRIREYLESAHIKEDQQLPSNEKLAEQFGVQKGTVRAALERLKEEGIVYSVKGVGTFAAKRKILRNMERFESFSEMAQQNGSTVTTKVLSCRVIPAGYTLAEEFGLPPERISQRLSVSARWTGDSSPEISHIPAYLVPELESKPLGGSLYRLLEEEYKIYLTG